MYVKCPTPIPWTQKILCNRKREISQFHSKTVDLASISKIKYFLFLIFHEKITKVNERQVL